MAPPMHGRSARVARRDGATAGGDAVGSSDDAILIARIDALEAKCDALGLGFRV